MEKEVKLAQVLKTINDRAGCCCYVWALGLLKIHKYFVAVKFPLAYRCDPLTGSSNGFWG